MSINTDAIKVYFYMLSVCVCMCVFAYMMYIVRAELIMYSDDIRKVRVDSEFGEEFCV